MTLATTEADMPAWVAVLAPAAQLAERIAGTEFVPGPMRNKPDVVCAAIMYGAELGLGPMQALAGIHVVDGRPQPSAELMRALILRAGHSIAVHEMTGTRARVSGLRAGRPEAERLVVEWTLDMARAAGLLGRSNWRAYPRALLIARATSDLARIVFPDVVKGMSYIAEDEAFAELENVPETPASVADSPAESPPALPRRKSPAKRAPARKPRLPDVPRVPPATVEHPAPDGSVDVPLPETLGTGEVPPGEAAPRPPVAPPPLPADRPDYLPEPVRDSEPEGAPEPIRPNELRGIMASFRDLGLDATRDRETRLGITSALAGRDIESTTTLTHHEALAVIGGIAELVTGALVWGADDNGVIRVWAAEPE